MLEPADDRILRVALPRLREVGRGRAVERAEAQDALGAEPLRLALRLDEEALELHPPAFSLAQETV